MTPIKGKSPPDMVLWQSVFALLMLPIIFAGELSGGIAACFMFGFRDARRWTNKAMNLDYFEDRPDRTPDHRRPPDDRNHGGHRLRHLRPASR